MFTIENINTFSSSLSDGWSDGTVVDWYYQETDWLPENVAPYQVELDKEERLIFAPSDDNRVIRKTDAEDAKDEAAGK